MDNGISKAAKRQADATRYAADKTLEGQKLAIDAYEKGYNAQLGFLQKQDDYNKGVADENVATYKPILDAFYRTMAEMEGAGGANGWMSKGLSREGLEDTEAYKFMLEQGNKSIDNLSSSTGGVFSGKRDKERMRFAQGLASQEYDREFARNEQLKHDRFNAANTLLNQTALGVTGTQASRYMTNIGDKSASANANYVGNLANTYQGTAANLANLELQNGRTQADYIMAKGQQSSNMFSNILGGGFNGFIKGSETGNPYGGMFLGAAGGAAGIGNSGAAASLFKI